MMQAFSNLMALILTTYTSEMLNKIVKSVTRCQYHQLSLEAKVKVEIWLSLLIFLKKIDM
jgi:hypothetical protein